MNENKKTPLKTIGWREWLSIPSLGVKGIKAKIDTGARSSCLHTHDFEIYECPETGDPRVRFELHPLTHSPSIKLACDQPISSVREVKDAGGHVEIRPFFVIETQVGDVKWDVEYNLSNREGMKFRMLLGRTALKERFLVDPTQSYLLGKNLSKAYRTPKRKGKVD